MGKLAKTVLFLACFLSFESLAFAGEREPENIDALKDLWKSQQTEIATAHIKYRRFQTGATGLLPLGPDQVKKILTSRDLAGKPDDLRIVINQLLSQPHPSSRPWSVLEFYYEGAKSKDVRHGDFSEVLLVTDKERVEYSPANHSAQIFAAGGSRRHMRSLEEFHTVPDPEAKYDIAEKKGSLWLLRSGSARFTVDTTTGALQDADYFANGKIAQQQIQRSFFTYPGGIVFPSLSAIVTYNPDETLYSVMLSWVEEAVFNKELPPDTFALPIPAKTNVFDYRNPNHERTFPRTGPADDVIAMTNARAPQSSEASGHTHWWIISNIVLLVLLLGVIFWRKFRPKRLPSNA